jgi:hypothetical protein
MKIFIIYAVKCGGNNQTLINNKGYIYKELTKNELNITEIQEMRGYKIIKLEELDISCPNPLSGSNTDIHADTNKFVFTNNHKLVPGHDYEDHDSDDDISSSVTKECYCNIT